MAYKSQCGEMMSTRPLTAEEEDQVRQAMQAEEQPVAQDTVALQDRMADGTMVVADGENNSTEDDMVMETHIIETLVTDAHWFIISCEVFYVIWGVCLFVTNLFPNRVRPCAICMQ